MSLFPVSDSFRSTRDAWWSARAVEARGTTRGRTPSLGAAQRKEDRWRLSGRAYLGAYKGLDGALIRFPAELLEVVQRQIEAIAPRLAAAYDRQLGALALAAWERWPTDTGLSRSLLDVEYVQRGDTFIGRVVSRAPYTVFIVQGQKSAAQRAKDEKKRRAIVAAARKAGKPLRERKSRSKTGGEAVYRVLLRDPGRGAAAAIVADLEATDGR